MKKKDTQVSSMLVQKHQLDRSEQQLSDLDSALAALRALQSNNSETLDDMLQTMEGMLLNQGIEFDEAIHSSVSDDIYHSVNSNLHPTDIGIQKLSLIDAIEFNRDMDWDTYSRSVEEYAHKNTVDLTVDPFKALMTNTQRVELEKRIKEDFTLKNANCDRYDYMIAGTCGVIGGLIDVFFVGMPGEGAIGKAVDNGVKGAVGKFAEAAGFDRKKKESIGYAKYVDKYNAKNKNPLDKLDKETWMETQAVQFLENKYRINYDQTHTNKEGKLGTGGSVKNLTPSNHHLKSLGHSPDFIGLFFSIYNQFTSTSSFVSNGKLITIETENFELKGNTVTAKIFCGFVNWLGHLFSDMAGSNSSISKRNRGSGIPIPFYNLLLLFDVGKFGGKDRQSFATIATQVFEKGYDLRHGIAMAIPVLITELLTRLMWASKQRFYHKKSWKECIPSASNPELRRMLLVAHGTLCLVDAGDAALRSGGEMLQFLLRTNIIGWARFGTLAIKELNAWYNSGRIDAEAVDHYLEQEYSRMLNSSGGIS